MKRLVVKCTAENRKKIGCGMLDGMPWCDYQTINSYCGYYDTQNTTGVNELLAQLDRLGQLEDEAEQREQGCEHCEPDCRNCGNKTFKCSPASRYPFECLKYMPASEYCPRCGKKLVK